MNISGYKRTGRKQRRNERTNEGGQQKDTKGRNQRASKC
jgi:hypothetical protein